MPAPTQIASTLILAVLLAIVAAWIGVILRLVFGLPVLPPNTPRIVPWRAGSVLAVVLTWLVLLASTPMVYGLAIRHRPAGVAAGANPLEHLSPGEIMTISAIENTATLALVPILLAITCGARLRDFGLVAEDFEKQVARGLVAYPLLAPIVFGVMFLSIRVWESTKHPLQDAMVQDRSPKMVTILVLAGVVLAPAVEELIFRGVLLGWLTRVVLGAKPPTRRGSMMAGFDEYLPDFGHPHLIETIEVESLGGVHEANTQDTAELAIPDPYAPPGVSRAPARFEPVLIDVGSKAVPLFAANVLVSLVFATLHGAVWPTPIPIFFLSLGLGFLYQRTGGIVAPIVLHMAFNGMSTLLLFLSVGGPPAPKAEPKVPVPGPAIRVIDRGNIFSIRLVDGPGKI